MLKATWLIVHLLTCCPMIVASQCNCPTGESDHTHQMGFVRLRPDIAKTQYLTSAMPIGLQHAHPGTPATGSEELCLTRSLCGGFTAYPAPGSGVLCGAAALAFADATAEAKEQKAED